MHGYGIYVYADGVTYEGEYKEDKKTGYGVYYWTDGRKYEGWWWDGKQHGLGIYKDPSKQKVKYGLWERGKRINWYPEDTIFQINEGNYNYIQEFKDEQSSKVIEANASFQRPYDFDEQIKFIKNELKPQTQ